MKRLESYVENRVVAWARKRGVLECKLTAMGSAGWPDRILWLKGGRPVLLEFKRRGERPTKLQQYRLDQLKTLGYEVFWTDDADEAIARLTKLDS